MNRIATMISCLGLCFMILTACTNTGGTQEDISETGDTISPRPLVHTVVMPAAETDPPVDTLTYIMGKFDPATHPSFVLVDAKYADRSDRYLHKATYAAFQEMYAAALAEGVKLTIISATRNFESQKGIWEAKWTGQRKIENGKDASVAYPDAKTRALKILEYSSMPGSSRHHWGTDMDLINLTNEYFDSGEGQKAYQWLTANAHRYGFCQPYTAGRPAGYQEERWHWSYLPLARPLTAYARKHLQDEMIGGFAGSETARAIGIVENYVLGINQGCLPE